MGALFRSYTVVHSYITGRRLSGDSLKAIDERKFRGNTGRVAIRCRSSLQYKQTAQKFRRSKTCKNFNITIDCSTADDERRMALGVLPQEKVLSLKRDIYLPS